MPIKAGNDVDAYCTKCRMDLAHIIHAIVDDKPAKVECKTCHGIHKYRAPKSVKEPKKKTTRKKAPAKKKLTKADKEAAKAQEEADKIAASWESLLEGKEDDAKPYRFADSYQVGEILRHTKFGFGVVENRLSPKKITVLFRAGRKILVDSRT